MSIQNSTQIFSSSTTGESFQSSRVIKRKLDEGKLDDLAITKEDKSLVNRVYSLVEKRRRALDPTDGEGLPFKKLGDFINGAAMRVDCLCNLNKLTAPSTLDDPLISDEDKSEVDKVWRRVQNQQREQDPMNEEASPLTRLENLIEGAARRVRLLSEQEQTLTDNEASRGNNPLKTITNNPTIFDEIDFTSKSS